MDSSGFAVGEADKFGLLVAGCATRLFPMTTSLELGTPLARRSEMPCTKKDVTLEIQATAYYTPESRRL